MSGLIPGRASRWLFAALMVGATGLFVVLGIWQWQRMGEKEALVATVAQRMRSAPVELPPPAQWPQLDAEQFDYQPVVLRGRLLPAQTVLVFTSLSRSRGAASGPGYWVMTPLALDTGGSVWVNRGFVPDTARAEFAAGGLVPDSTDALVGIARLSEVANAFTPAIDAASRIDWIRNVERLSGLADPALAPFAPVYVDLEASAPGVLPQGGETVLEFPNNHLGYALTWFGFALLTPALLGFWLWQTRHSGGR